MYTLYYNPGVCSLAIHALLIELNQEVELVSPSSVENYTTINPTGAVPVLVDDGLVIREGAAIALHLMEKHPSAFLPTSGTARTNAIQWLMIANATVHPAYSKLFFTARAIEDEKVKLDTLKKGAAAVEKIWADIDTHLAENAYVCGDHPTAADFMLTIYANWGQFFPVEIVIGDNVKRMIRNIITRPSYKAALEAEQVDYKAVA